MMSGPEDLVLIGRAEQVDIAKGLSSSYACQNCCVTASITGHAFRALSRYNMLLMMSNPSLLEQVP